MKKTAQEPKVTENPLYHDAWMLLRKYREICPCSRYVGSSRSSMAAA